MNPPTTGVNTNDWLDAISGRSILAYIQHYSISQELALIDLGDYIKEFRGTPTEDPVSQIRAHFNTLVEKWSEESLVLSSAEEMATLPSYKAIIDMGYQAVPLILEELTNRPDHWFYALKVITDEDPVPPQDAGDIDRMARAWIKWGRESALID